MGKSKEKKKRVEDERVEEESVGAAKVKELEALNVQIKTISENPEKSSPIIGYFSSGFDPLKNSENPDSKLGACSSVKVYKDASRNPKNPRMELVVGVGGSTVNFVGTNYSGEAGTPQLCNYALGVLDKETGVLKMVPIAANKIFRLEPRITGQEEVENENEMQDAAMEMTRTYATKTNIRKDEKRKTLRETGGAGASEVIDHKLKGVVFKEAALEAIAEAGNSRNIPPYDLEADAAEKAYPLDKIILKGEWNYLQDIFELVQGESELTPDVYPTFVCNRIGNLQRAKDESSKRRIGGILSYITHLIKFKDRHSIDGVSSAKHHKLPAVLSRRFSTMFTPNEKNRRIPDDKLNLLISYVLVLSLFADNFRSDPSDIAKDLRMNPVVLRTHYEYLGCKFVRENKVLLATLDVPLEFQTIKRKRRRA